MKKLTKRPIVKKFFIYGLKDPRTNEIRYIGKAKNPNVRLREHLLETKKNKSNTRKNTWIKNLLNENLKPLIVILEEVFDFNWQEKESYWINYYKNAKLTNMTSGGDGLKNITEETKRKISEAGKRRIITDQARENMRQAQLRRKRSPEEIQKLRNAVQKAHLGVKRSDETKEKLRQSHLGKKQPAEQIEKRISKLIGKKRTKEQKEVLRQIAKKRDPEIMEKLRLHNIGTKRTEEQKERMREGIKKSTKRKHKPE